jgi:thiol-disulfide isomerase/thioredoxin
MRKLAVLLLALVSTAAFAAQPAARAGAPVALMSAADLKQALAAERGKVVVLNLWATWCTSCLKEIPDLMQLERELKGKGMTLLAVGMDDPTELSRITAFRDKFFPAFSTSLRSEAEMDTVVSVVDPAWNELLPTTYLIGRDGKVVKRIQGKKSLEEFRAEVGPLLK